MGNHTWDNKELFEFIDDATKLVRPANFPGKDVPGLGWTKLRVNQATLAVINLQGRVFLPPLDDPFATADRLVDEIRKETPVIFVDMHAEATSEKRAIAEYLKGRVSAVVGTHTHVQTSDEQIIDHQTAFLTDAGMTGPTSGILGMQSASVIGRFLNQRPARYEVETNDAGILGGCVIDINDETGHATKIKRVLIDPAHPYDN